jgi:hypothetical protein
MACRLYVAGRPTRRKAGPETNAPQSAQEGGVETRHAARNMALEFQWDANTSQRAANHSGLASLGFCPPLKRAKQQKPKEWGAAYFTTRKVFL